MKLIFLLLLIVLPGFQALAVNQPLRLKIEGLRSGQGQIAYSVFSAEDPKGFPGNPEKAKARGVVELKGVTEMTIETSNLPEGNYAVALLHDENSDSKLNTNFIGIPREGFGFSNNPIVLFGPPAFKKAVLHHPGEHHIQMKYMM